MHSRMARTFGCRYGVARLRKIPNQKEYFDLWPLYIHGNDAYGHLIFVEKIAEVDVDYLKKIMTVDEALHVRMVCHEAIAELKNDRAKY